MCFCDMFCYFLFFSKKLPALRTFQHVVLFPTYIFITFFALKTYLYRGRSGKKNVQPAVDGSTDAFESNRNDCSLQRGT